MVNGRNKVMPSNNTSGHVGVQKTKTGKFTAKILKKHIGTFDTLEESVNARQEVQRETPHFTERHGKPSIVNLGYAGLKLAKTVKKAQVRAEKEEELRQWYAPNYSTATARR